MKRIVLDITRTTSPKSIETPSGVDRVERAYIRRMLEPDIEACFLTRFGRGVALLNASGMKALMACITGETPWGRTEIMRSFRGFRGQVESEIKRHAIFAGALADAPMPKSFTYINVGLTHLDAEKLQQLRTMGAARCMVMLHDMIPLDNTDLQTPASVARFEKMARMVAEHADTILSNSQFTTDRIAYWFGQWGQEAEIVTALLGVEVLQDLAPTRAHRPAFVQLGTIEPRKNHAFTLKLWEDFQELPEAERPKLHLIGRRGWLNETVFQHLDTHPQMGRDIIEHGSLGDREAMTLLKSADALLFPSHTEGFGLPLLEALALGVPVIASDIPVFREIGGDHALYLPTDNATSWKTAIIEQSQQGQLDSKLRLKTPEIPTWDQHFAHVLACI